MFLWIGLALALWLNYETWQKDYAPAAAAVTASQARQASGARCRDPARRQ